MTPLTDNGLDIQNKETLRKYSEEVPQFDPIYEELLEMSVFWAKELLRLNCRHSVDGHLSLKESLRRKHAEDRFEYTVRFLKFEDIPSIIHRCIGEFGQHEKHLVWDVIDNAPKVQTALRNMFFRGERITESIERDR